MSKELKQIIITVAGLVILAIVIMNNIKTVKARKPRKAAVQTQEAVPEAKNQTVVKVITADSKEVSLQKKRDEIPWGRDPFVIDIDKTDTISELSLAGISFGKDQTGYAFINNEIVKKGDYIGGYEVREIYKDKVLLKKENQSFYLTFPEEGIESKVPAKIK